MAERLRRSTRNAVSSEARVRISVLSLLLLFFFFYFSADYSSVYRYRAGAGSPGRQGSAATQPLGLSIMRYPGLKCHPWDGSASRSVIHDAENG